MNHSTFPESNLSRIIDEALFEDIGMGDVTTDSIVPANLQGRAELLVKAEGVLAGVGVAAQVFYQVDSDLAIETRMVDGSAVKRGDVVASINGSAASILKAERTALNFLQRMSGIATLTQHFVRLVSGTKTRITDTRKTAPTLRLIDKLAVEIGGGVNHRFGLDDMVLIKDNHIAVAGGIRPAIERCLTHLQSEKRTIKVEVETKNIAEVREALTYDGIHRIMLDNFSIVEMREAIRIISGRVEVEASGNVSPETVRSIAETGVDFISIGALTHSPSALDISLEFLPATH